MRNKPRWLLFSLLLIAGLAAAFWWLDFRAAQSQTNSTSSISTAASLPQGTAAPRRDVAVYVAGDGWLYAAIRTALVPALQSSGSFQQVELLSNLPQQAAHPLLIVEINDLAIIWTPVYAQATLDVVFAYTSEGDAAWRNQETAVLEQANEIKTKGSIHINHRSMGLISRRSYYNILGQQVASQINGELAKILADPF